LVKKSGIPKVHLGIYILPPCQEAEQSFVHGFPNINAPSCNNSQGNQVRKFILIDKTKTA